MTELTQSVQKDILESLKQLIETTQREMQEMQEENAPSQPPQGEPKESLVALIAEIRMLKNLQLQVNRRTRQVDTLLQSAPEEEGPRLRKQLRELAIRQNRLVESAKELAKQPQ